MFLSYRTGVSGLGTFQVCALAVLPTLAQGQRPIVLDSGHVVSRGLPYPSGGYSELKDGRLLTLGGPEQVVLVVDVARKRIDTVGREGRGPGEYTLPKSSRVLADGRLALLDPLNARLTVWTPEGKLDTAFAVPTFALHFDVALDPLGRVYWPDAPAESPMFQSPGDRRGRHQDSAWIYRLSPPSSQYDTVMALIQRGAAWIGSTYKLPLLYGAQDAWGVVPSGMIWVARVREHRVDRLSTDGRWTIGTARPWSSVPTTDSDVRIIPDLSRNPKRDSIPRPMAKVKPPFDYAVASDEGEVWTHLSQPAGAQRELFAVFPVSGPSRATISLPARRRLVRISRAYIFALSEDEDGSGLLERFARPR